MSQLINMFLYVFVSFEIKIVCDLMNFIIMISYILHVVVKVGAAVTTVQIPFHSVHTSPTCDRLKENIPNYTSRMLQ